VSYVLGNQWLNCEASKPIDLSLSGLIQAAAGNKTFILLQPGRYIVDEHGCIVMFDLDHFDLGKRTLFLDNDDADDLQERKQLAKILVQLGVIAAESQIDANKLVKQIGSELGQRLLQVVLDEIIDITSSANFKDIDTFEIVFSSRLKILE
jgi:hypothetical protein